MKRNIFLALAILIPIVFVITYWAESQYQYSHRQETILPITWKLDDKGKIFGYLLDFGLNPCNIPKSNFQTIAVCLKPEPKAAYLIAQLPADCSLFIIGYCANNYFYARRSDAPSVEFNPDQKIPTEAVLKISSDGVAEVIALRAVNNVSE